MSEQSPLIPIRIRKMENYDLEKVIELDQLSFSLPWPPRSFRFELEDNPASRSWVAEVNEPGMPPRLVGMIVTWLIVDEAHIATLAVEPTFRRHGIAQRLLAHALIEAYHSGATRSYLEVRRGNEAAIGMYQKFGYIISGIRKKYYQDNGEDALLMDLYPLDLNRLVAFQ